MKRSVVLLLVLNTFASSVALYSSTSPVKVLDHTTFQKTVKNGHDVTLVEFFAPWCGHCKAFAPQVELAAKALDGVLRVVAVEDEAAMASEGVKGFPTVRLYRGKGETPLEYTGARTADGLVNFAMKELKELVQKRLSGKKSTKGSSSSKKSDVIELTENDFDDRVMKDADSVWFIEFYAPWCGHCKALAPKWENVGTQLKGKVKVGKVDATANTVLAKRFGIQGFPTLYLFPSGKKLVSSVVPYSGPREEDDMVHFALDFATAAVKAEQLLSNDQFTSECQKTVCVISILPDLLDTMANGRNNYLDQLNQAARAAATMPVKFFWLEGGKNFDFEEALHLQFGYPAVVAVHLEKKKFAVHKGHFAPDELRSFVTSLVSGRQPLSTIPKHLPALVKMDPWDGKDPTPPPVDETEARHVDDDDHPSSKDEL